MLSLCLHGFPWGAPTTPNGPKTITNSWIGDSRFCLLMCHVINLCPPSTHTHTHDLARISSVKNRRTDGWVSRLRMRWWRWGRNKAFIKWDKRHLWKRGDPATVTLRRSASTRGCLCFYHRVFGFIFILNAAGKAQMLNIYRCLSAPITAVPCGPELLKGLLPLLLSFVA